MWPRLAVDDRGRVHLVWTNIPWPGRAVVYARSDDGGDTWLEPEVIDSADRVDYLPDYGPIIINVATQGEDEVHLMWDGAPTVERNYVRSMDGGKTWSAPTVAFPEVTLGGRSGTNPLVFDGAGTLHALSIHSNASARHATWQGRSWAESDQVPTQGPAEQLSAIITLGDTLHVIWTDKVKRPYTNWYVRGQLDAPKLTPEPLPTAVAVDNQASGAADNGAPAATIEPEATPEATQPPDRLLAGGVSGSPAGGAIIGIAGAVAAIGLAILAKIMISRR